MDSTTLPVPPRLGRCNECDFALFVADPSGVVNVDDFNGVKNDGRAYRVGNNGYFGRCPKRHRVFPLKTIRGTYSKDHKCDSRCLNARGHNCTCSCGGANHGRGFATTNVVTAAATAAPVREPQHIGEVDKYITGTATIITKREGVGRFDNTLLVFETVKGDTIKWFAPRELVAWFLLRPLDPGNSYEVGREVTFRAKVKAHEDHEHFGKTTVVLYLEEV